MPARLARVVAPDSSRQKVSDTPLLSATDVRLSYDSTLALRGVSLNVQAGEVIAIVGKSGSGKSSLLYCLAGVLRCDSGSVLFDGTDFGSLDTAALDALRRRSFGFVFQFGELVPEMTLVENVALPLVINGMSLGQARRQALALLDRLNIRDIADKRSAEVSGGELQRAAVARSVIHAPRVVFADEPTGSLDQENARIVLDQLLSLASEDGVTVVIVTHSPTVAEMATKQFVLADGALTSAEFVA
jgi:putative ABC transport system ATP-binding protein